MEVNRTNFQKVLQDLDGVIQKASFFAIDGEFTGLSSGPEANAFDTPAQYYDKVRLGSMDFLLVQFGLSIFTYDKNKQKYLQQSYNFYVFPRPLNRAAPDCRFTCQASSMTFLAEQGFDFNKLFSKGIPYLTSADEEKLSEKISERQKIREDPPELIPIPEDNKPHVEEICSRIDDFLNSEAEELTIDKCNAFIRRIINQEARMRWPNKLRLEGKRDGSGQYLIVQRTGTKEEEEKKEAERREKDANDLREAVGLSALLRKIADSGKLMVGHNMLLDLCHIIRQFFAPLPESYREFKSLVHCLFPKLLDTKVMSQSEQFKESIPCSILNALHDTVSKPPYLIPDIDAVPDQSYEFSANKFHEAGYDAYITGLCFISMSNYLGSLQTPKVNTVLPDSQLLNPFMNKLIMTRLKDFPHIDLIGKDPKPSRDHVFYITFPKEWKLNDIAKIFSPFGGAFISWLSDTSAYASLHKRDQAAAVKTKRFAIPNFYLKQYAEHQAALEAKELSSAQGDRKRKLSASDDTSPAKNDESAKIVDDGWEVASGNSKDVNSMVNRKNGRVKEPRGIKSWLANIFTNLMNRQPEQSVFIEAEVENAGKGSTATRSARRSKNPPKAPRYSKNKKKNASTSTPRRSYEYTDETETVLYVDKTRKDGVRVTYTTDTDRIPNTLAIVTTERLTDVFEAMQKKADNLALKLCLILYVICSVLFFTHFLFSPLFAPNNE